MLHLVFSNWMKKLGVFVDHVDLCSFDKLYDSGEGQNYSSYHENPVCKQVACCLDDLDYKTVKGHELHQFLFIVLFGLVYVHNLCCH